MLNSLIVANFAIISTPVLLLMVVIVVIVVLLKHLEILLNLGKVMR